MYEQLRAELPRTVSDEAIKALVTLWCGQNSTIARVLTDEIKSLALKTEIQTDLIEVGGIYFEP